MRAARVHLSLIVFWVLLSVPTLLWWYDSVLLVLLINIYAIVVGHWGSYLSARAERRLEKDHPSEVCRYGAGGEVRV